MESSDDSRRLCQSVTSERKRLLTLGYHSQVITALGQSCSPSAELLYYIGRLNEHLELLSAVAIRSKSHYSPSLLLSNDQFMCAEICISRVSAIDRLWPGPYQRECEALWSAIVGLFRSIESRSDLALEVTDSVHCLYVGSSFLRAVAQEEPTYLSIPGQWNAVLEKLHIRNVNQKWLNVNDVQDFTAWIQSRQYN